MVGGAHPANQPAVLHWFVMKTKKKQQSEDGSLKVKHWDNILKLYRACLKNASDLADEAELLCENCRYARAMALALFAIEEIGKSQIVADFFNDMVSNSEMEEAFKKHEIKSAYNFRKFVLDNMTIEYNPSDGKEYHKTRMEALYVDYLDGYKPQEPENFFTKEHVSKIIDSVRKEINDISLMEVLTERIGSKSFMK